MPDRCTILITGAAGNLGSRLSRQLMSAGHELRLMYHRTPLPEDVAHGVNVRPIKADLGDPSTLPPAVNSSKRCVDIGRVLESLFAIPPTTDLRFVGEMLPPLGGSESV